MTTGVVRQYGRRIGSTPTGRTRRECWAAVIDGDWRAERQDEPGTPWTIKHLPTGRIVPCILGRHVDGVMVWHRCGDETYGTLQKCVTAVRSGTAARNLDVGATAPEWT